MPSSILNSDDGVISGTSGLKSSGGDDGNLVFQSKGTETARINTDKQIVAAAGTASLPALTTTGDVNTGIFFPAADTIAFAEGGAEAMRITSSGQVGIGSTATGGARLYVDGGNVSNAGQWASSAIAISNTTNANTYSQISFGYVASTTNAPAYIGYLNTDSAGNGRGSLVFGTRNVTTDTQPTERMRIASDGIIYTHTAYQTSGNTNGLKILLNAETSNTEAHITSITSAGDTRFFMAFRQNATSGNASGSIVGSISGNASNAAYNTSSDYRLKENIEPLTGALTTVAQLRPCTWIWKTNNSAGQGFVAHELAEVVPDCVTGEKDAVDKNGNPVYQGVDTSFLVATLTAAIQELSAKNDALEARIAALEAVPGNE